MIAANWLQAVDISCERISPPYWAEPVNAVSNLSLVLAALWACAEARKRGLGQPILWILIGMAGAIGIGSFLFHTHANRWSELADTLPIWSFVGLFVLTAMHVSATCPWRAWPAWRRSSWRRWC
ncbi:MAG: ceramidase [Rhodobacteraceae bacterium]|nr:ceramidase [Paracoccaceae bacterium]